ncbi:family 20 glycosylhydrolase [Haladaptatus pallidirubidus]
MLDYPRFSYCGVHLSVAHHFFSVNKIKQYLDYLAQYMVDFLHLDLTDD